MKIANEKKPSVSVIVTAYNEEKNLEPVIADIKKLRNRYDLEIIVVDDGSTDSTRSIAESLPGIVVLANTVNRGKGAAFRKGYKLAQGEYIVQIDADKQFLPREIPKLINTLSQETDVALGTRYEKDSIVDEDSVNYVRRYGSYFLSFITSLAARQRITDVMAGFKGFRRETLFAINPVTDHFGYEAEIAIKAAKRGYKIKNVPISYKRRREGTSSVQTFRDGFRVLGTILKATLVN